ncbi:MAG: hydroxyethylthiazole kinase [Deltaproteobacteria bacterium]|nr:hydroxyethylthiazole kinase [Deltaproteobacteria bacterium]
MSRPQAADVWRDVERVRSVNPLIFNITNYVVTNTTANALLALGASPAMAESPLETAELAGLASALVLNIGTPTSDMREGMFRALHIANDRGIPVVLDPVAAGVTRLRMELCRRFLTEHRIEIVRGNASEIMALAGENAVPKGADSANTTDEAREAALGLARTHGCVVCVSGSEDIVTDGTVEIRVANGNPMMTRVTGLGCTATALVGAFAAINDDHVQACAHAMTVMGVAGELAAAVSPGPGSLQMHFYDRLYSLNADELVRLVR